MTIQSMKKLTLKLSIKLLKKVFMGDWRPDEKRIFHRRLDEMLDDWDDEDDGEWDVHAT